MEIKFENRIHMTPAIMTEMMWNQMRGMKIALRVALAAVLSFAVLGIVLTLINGFLATSILTPVVIASLLLYLCWQMPNSTIRGIVKELARHNGGKLPESVTTFGDTIVTTTMDNSIEYGYDRIRRVESLPHSYMLVVGKRETLPMNRDGFTVGDFESFKQFLREKRPDLTIPE